MIDILVVEDNNIVRKGICRLLNAQPDMNVMAEAVDGLSALSFLANVFTLHVMIADFNMPGLDGLQLTKQVASKYPLVAIIILTMHEQRAYREQALAAGADAYLLKGDDEAHLLKTIREVYKVKLINAG